MRILHVYSGNLFGGIETYLLTLAKTQALMPEMQHEFVLCFEGRLATELRAAGAIVHSLNAVQTRKPWTVWKARSQLKRLLQSQAFDVVICHACWAQVIFGSVVKRQNIPLGFLCHDGLKGSHWIERWAKHTVPDLVIANSDYTANTVGVLYPQAPCQTIYYPVLNTIPSKAEVRSRVRSALQTPEDRIVIVQACRLEPWKGHQLLLSALGELQVDNWEVWIAGGVQRSHEANYLQQLEAQARELGIADKVKFLGQRSDVPELLAAADIHCQPNLGAEPFGIAFIEALYAGLPMVTTAMGGAKEIVDQTCGYLVPPNDPQAIAQKLERLITNSEARDRLAKGGIARGKLLCSPSTQLAQLYEVLKQNFSSRSGSMNKATRLKVSRSGKVLVN